MQRLFSSFPNSWPGCGLALLRLAAAVPMIVSATTVLYGTNGSGIVALQLLTLLASVLLVVGLFTPLSASILALIEIGSGNFPNRGVDPATVHACFAIGLVMLGPGAWSVDARLFGRRVVRF